MPTNYGTTPGGTMFAHTPGGTRIVYERAFLMQMRQSPLAKTPPANLPLIPGVTVPSSGSSPDSKSNQNHNDTQKLQTVKGTWREGSSQQRRRTTIYPPTKGGLEVCVFIFSFTF